MPGRAPAQRSDQPGARSLAEVVADNLRDWRALRRLSQREVAERMGHFGYSWSTATVSEIERLGRVVDVNELLCLAMALETSLPDLLDPAGVDGRHGESLDYGRSDVPPMPVSLARKVLRGDVGVYPMFQEGGRIILGGSYRVCRVEGRPEEVFEEANREVKDLMREHAIEEHEARKGETE